MKGSKEILKKKPDNKTNPGESIDKNIKRDLNENSQIVRDGSLYLVLSCNNKRNHSNHFLRIYSVPDIRILVLWQTFITY